MDTMTDRIPQIRLFAGTQINWSVFQSFAQEVLGRSVTERLDLYNIQPDTFGGFCAQLNEIVDRGSEPNEKLLDFIEHISISVIGVCYEADLSDICPPGSRISFVYSPSASSTHALFIMSGNMDDWRTRIIAALLWKKKLNPYAIMFYNVLHESINKGFGVYNIFEGYRKCYEQIPGFPSLFILEKR